MKKNDNDFDKLLSRQLNRQGLSDDELPLNLIEWKKFLQHVNQVYIQSTQDRYLLERSLSLVSREMSENELKISQLNHKLIIAAKRARIAEMSIASSLHNIGNILNSVNTSSGLLEESLRLSTINKLESVVSMLKEHIQDLGDYLTQDPKGKLLPDFIEAAVASIKNDYEILSDEINNITISTGHMIEIITKQKELTNPSSTSEDSFTVKSLLEEAIQLSLGPKNEVQIIKKINVDDQIKIFNDKHKILQILVNLIRNSSDSLLEVNSKNKQIEIIATSISDKAIAIAVKDNGAGIQEDNIKKIFNFGFTTKPNGHGFGLHNSALIAKELGGLLEVESAGHNKGATFTLQFPITLSWDE